jgi:hypothetical protein
MQGHKRLVERLWRRLYLKEVARRGPGPRWLSNGEAHGTLGRQGSRGQGTIKSKPIFKSFLKFFRYFPCFKTSSTRLWIYFFAPEYISENYMYPIPFLTLLGRARGLERTSQPSNMPAPARHPARQEPIWATTASSLLWSPVHWDDRNWYIICYIWSSE